MDANSDAALPAWRGGWAERSTTLSREGGGTKELTVLVGGRGGARARTPLRHRATPHRAFRRQWEQLRVVPPSLAPAKESGPSAFHARRATLYS
uniref:Uncharacterized protein n=1 Tax=Oryza barthii TaxID=65489 RepID=A0A0D3EKT7_9ORYZ